MRWKGNPLQNLTTRKGNWRYSEYFALVDTAHEWGRAPQRVGAVRTGRGFGRHAELHRRRDADARLGKPGAGTRDEAAIQTKAIA